MLWDYLEHLSYKSIYLSSILLILVSYLGHLIFVPFHLLLMNYEENITHETEEAREL